MATQNNNQSIFDAIKTQVENGFGSIYSKEDVLSIIEKLEEATAESQQPSFLPSAQQIKEITEKIASELAEEINNMDMDEIVDYSSAELELNYNEISVTSIEMKGNFSRNLKSTISEQCEEVLIEIFKLNEVEG
jgi:hypothetical protein